MHAVRFSLVVATRDRTAALERLLVSLAAQTYRSFEVIVVDQNLDERLNALLVSACGVFPLHRLRRSATGGASRARNEGLAVARGDYVIFPDDDCWFPPTYLEQVDAVLRESGADLLTGRPADESGRTINGRFEAGAGPIRRRTVFTTQIEWNMAVSRTLLQRLGGYDEAISLGGPTLWQAAEGFDLLLRALELGARCHYDPSLVGHHEELPVLTPDAAMVRKGRVYARGLGHVLRKHRFGEMAIAYWIGRSLLNLLLAMLAGKTGRVRYFVWQAIGRWEGWSGQIFRESRWRSPITTAMPSGQELQS